jgi:para-nitrobenzyl esterase
MRAGATARKHDDCKTRGQRRCIEKKIFKEMEMKNFFVLWIAVLFFLAADSAPAQNFCGQPVPTKQGPVLGKQDKKSNACTFKGIPYALPPIKELRWRAPQAPASRSQTLQAFEFGPSCVQKEDISSGGKSKSFSEDCLTLNIYRPAKPGVFPVMFWIHGGGYTQGAGSYEMYDGAPLAGNEDVVVVTINYRLGFFGFLAMPELAKEDPNHSTGNYGILDQIAALKWVSENISNFGGDPKNVTIFGESAGGVSVCTLLATPLAAGLFQRGIIESGGCDLADPLDKGYRQGKDLTKALNCEGNDALSCLRQKPAQSLLLPSKDLITDAATHIDHYVLADQPVEVIKKGNFNRVPMIIGSNRDEFNLIMLLTPGGIFASRKTVEKNLEKQLGPRAQEVLKLYSFDDYPRPAYLMGAAFTDGFGSRAFSAAEAATPYTPVYLYRFDWDEERLGKIIGAFHGLEIPFVFGTLDARNANIHVLLKPKAMASGRPISKKMMKYWATFAKTGDPNAAGLEKWPLYKVGSRDRIYFDNQIKTAPLSAREIERYQYFSSISVDELAGKKPAQEDKK